jgi:crotonobetainyl-CoA:carnitine CoA-transferase CaiB-like acyl-CoA transferase
MDEVPRVGQHTQSILRELGLSDAELQALRDAKAI